MTERITALEELVFLTVAGLAGEAYGIAIQERLERAGVSVSLGVVYSTLDRLEDKGHVTSSLGQPTAARGGRRKRLFSTTPGGRAAVAASPKVRARLLRHIEGNA